MKITSLLSIKVELVYKSFSGNLGQTVSHKLSLSKIFIISLVVIFVLSGCENLEPVVKEGSKAAFCERYPAYKYAGGDCCIDINDNDICEDDEPRPPEPKDECDFKGKKQCHGGDVYICEDIDGDGYDERKLYLNCADDEACRRGECMKIIECGDRICDEEIEDCDSCSQDCLKAGERCCDGKSMAVECCFDSECGDDLKECKEYKCVDIEFCGNGYCAPEIENCDNCSPDCKKEDEVCCDGEAKKGDCCTNKDCGEYTCMENLCITTEITPLNETEIMINETEEPPPSNQTDNNTVEVT